MELGFSAWPLGDSCCDSACWLPYLLGESGVARVRGGQGGSGFFWAAHSGSRCKGSLA